MTIPYGKLKRFLMEELAYPEEEAINAIALLREADDEVKCAFARYWKTGAAPKETIHGIRISALVELRGMDPVAALLAAAELKRRPRAVKWMLTHSMDIRRTTPEDRKLLARLSEENAWNLAQTEQPEDTSDIEFEDTSGQKGRSKNARHDKPSGN